MTTYQRKGGTYRRNGKTYTRKGGTVNRKGGPTKRSAAPTGPSWWQQKKATLKYEWDWFKEEVLEDHPGRCKTCRRPSEYRGRSIFGQERTYCSPGTGCDKPVKKPAKSTGKHVSTVERDVQIAAFDSTVHHDSNHDPC